MRAAIACALALASGAGMDPSAPVRYGTVLEPPRRIVWCDGLLCWDHAGRRAWTWQERVEREIDEALGARMRSADSSAPREG